MAVGHAPSSILFTQFPGQPAAAQLPQPRKCRQAHLDALRFWLERGVDGIRLDACNFHFHDLELRSNPPAVNRDTATVSDVNPYGMQAHIYDKSRPENLPFLQKLRVLLDEYKAVAIGEVGADDSLAVMAEYTADGDKLQMAYSFNLLVPTCSSHYIRKQVENFEARVKGGWASWSVGNHDVQRVATRWGGPSAPVAFAKMILAMQLSLKGTPCLYQGDELAFAEADVPFELLQDPYGITFWPEFKGRDGCRTPMAWTTGANGGFTEGKPWLPVSPDHLAKAASVQEGDEGSSLEFTRKFLAWRRKLPQLTRGAIQFFDAPEPVLALRRDAEGERGIIAVFNLGSEPVSCTLPQAVGAEQMEGYGLPGTVVDGQVQLPAFGAWFGYAR